MDSGLWLSYPIFLNFFMTDNSRFGPKANFGIYKIVRCGFVV